MEDIKNLIINILEANNVKNIKFANEEIRCCCPFHHEINPSFSINIRTGKYICFSGKCGVKGDLYSFISKLTGVSYNEAKRNFEINLQNLKYKNIIENTLELFKEKSKEKDYIKYNNYKFAELKDLQDEQKILNIINVSKKISDIVKLKICLTNPYRRRLVVPISENIYEFRDILKQSDKKCLYEAGVKISNYLFNIIVNENDKNIFLTEGTKDAMSVAGFGFNSCCTFGINISDKQIANILKLGINKVYIARDNDEAGYKSSINTFNILKEYIDCQIIKYPEDFKYKDPNEIVNREEFINLLKFNINV